MKPHHKIYNVLGLLYEHYWDCELFRFELETNSRLDWPVLKLEFVQGEVILSKDEIFNELCRTGEVEDYLGLDDDFFVQDKFGHWKLLTLAWHWDVTERDVDSLFSITAEEVDSWIRVLKGDQIAKNHEKLHKSGFFN